MTTPKSSERREWPVSDIDKLDREVRRLASFASVPTPCASVGTAQPEHRRDLARRSAFQSRFFASKQRLLPKNTSKAKAVNY
jgi:hypothetical protein